MLREIKFRAWDKNDDQFSDDYHIGLDGRLFWYEIDSGEWFEGYGSNVVIQQFTGLKDKNGKDIYEGTL